MKNAEIGRIIYLDIYDGKQHKAESIKEALQRALGIVVDKAYGVFVDAGRNDTGLEAALSSGGLATMTDSALRNFTSKGLGAAIATGGVVLMNSTHFGDFSEIEVGAAYTV